MGEWSSLLPGEVTEAVLVLAILLEVHFLWDRKSSLKSTQTEKHTKKTLSQASKTI